MPTDPNAIREAVRSAYGQIARSESRECCAPACGCAEPLSATAAEQLGYSEDEIAVLPEGADLGLGCGNPQAIAALKPGETVLDLGSGAGFDCFLAARQVGPRGPVTGGALPPDMLRRALDNATKVGLGNVEFRLGEIERLPVAD